MKGKKKGLIPILPKEDILLKILFQPLERRTILQGREIIEWKGKRSIKLKTRHEELFSILFNDEYQDFLVNISSKYFKKLAKIFTRSTLSQKDHFWDFMARIFSSRLTPKIISQHSHCPSFYRSTCKTPIKNNPEIREK